MYSSPLRVTIWHAKGDKGEPCFHRATPMPGSPLKYNRDVRARWYLLADRDGQPIHKICTTFGISRKTYYKWRHRDLGPSDHRYRSRKLHPQAKLTGRVRLLVHDLKTRYNYGPRKMAIVLRVQYEITVSPSALYKFFKKRHLIRKPQRKLPWYRPMRERYVARRPGENVQMDTKYVPGPDQTWVYQFRCIDQVTGLQAAVDRAGKTAADAIIALRIARRSFPFPILGIQTDNGGEFRGMFAVVVQRLGITHRFIPKRSAPWNGKVERANRSVDDEYYLNPERPWSSLAQYVRWYNHERPHLGRGMNGMTPIQKLHQYLTQHPEVSPLKVN